MRFFHFSIKEERISFSPFSRASILFSTSFFRGVGLHGGERYHFWIWIMKMIEFSNHEFSLWERCLPIKRETDTKQKKSQNKKAAGRAKHHFNPRPHYAWRAGIESWAQLLSRVWDNESTKGKERVSKWVRFWNFSSRCLTLWIRGQKTDFMMEGPHPLCHKK